MITFCKVNFEDIPLMHKWFNMQHVQSFYSLREWSEEEVLRKLSPDIKGEKPVYGFIVYDQDLPIGYIQYYRLVDYPWEEQDFSKEVREQAAGIDLFIGDPSYVGKGVGSKMVNAFLKERIEPFFHYCVADPDERNQASVRMFEKCGFVAHKLVATKDALGKPVRLQLMMKVLQHEK